MKKEISDELKNIAPLLQQRQGQKEGFQIPDNYFEDFENQLLQQVAGTTTTREATIVPFYKRWASAAALALLFGGSLWMWQQQTTYKTIASLSPEEITIYIADNIEEFGDDLLEQELSIQAFPDMEFQEEDLEVIMEELGTDMEIEDF